MTKLITLSTLCVFVCSTAWSGVVIEMQQTVEGSGGAVTETMYAQGTMLRMEPAAGKGTVIFRDDTLYLLDDKNKRAQKISRQDMEAMGAQLDDAMKEMEAQMAKLPAEQRAMMEKMMKGGGIPGMGAAGEEPPPRRLETGGTERIGDYACTVHTMYEGDQKAWEVCSSGEALQGDAAEAMEAFRAMSDFANAVRESLRQLPFAGMIQIDTPYHAMDEIEGFPVRVRVFRDGKPIDERTLKSITARNLDMALFSVPSGYKVESVSDDMKKMKKRR